MAPPSHNQADPLRSLGLIATSQPWPSTLPDDNPVYIPSTTQNLSSTGRGILIGMLSALGFAILVIFIIGLIYFFRYTSHGRIFLDRIGRPGEFDDEQAFAREEAEALEAMDDIQRAEYMRAKAYVQSNPPESVQADISLSQFLAIQEKGVSAWEFEPELEIANCFVEGRTEIEFFDSECSVQTNLPVPKQNEVYYWEAKIFDKPDSTTLGIGMTTKPYPLFRMPGYHKTSVAYLSPGHRRFNQPFTPLTNYGPPFVRGDVVGVGYRPRTGTVFFTRNGKKLEDVTHTLKSQNLFPTVGSTGPATVHVNFGQMGFVYIEANVKKWGLAPLTGSLAPPPPYGSEQGSILLEGADRGVPGDLAQSALSPPGGSSWHLGHGRSRSAQVRAARGQNPTSPGPQRSPTDISLAQLSIVDFQEGADEDEVEANDTSVSGVSTMQPLGLSNSPPPEYTSPLPQQTEWPSRNQSRQATDYFNSSHQHSSSHSSQKQKSKRRSRGQNSSQGRVLNPPPTESRYQDSPDPSPASLQRSLNNNEANTLPDGESSTHHATYHDENDDNSATRRPRTAVQHTRSASQGVEGRHRPDDSDQSSPPIPTYDAAVAQSREAD